MVKKLDHWLMLVKILQYMSQSNTVKHLRHCRISMMFLLKVYCQIWHDNFQNWPAFG